MKLVAATLECLDVAHTILAQLGGGKFLAMTGARSLVGAAGSLSFKLPAGAKDKINCVLVSLTPEDTYELAFYAVRGRSVRIVATVRDVYISELRRTFEEHTGLRTSL